MPASRTVNPKRQAILEAATTLFLERGFSGTSMSELLRLVGGSKTTIYTHFGDKAGLFTAVVDELLEATVAFSDSQILSSLSLRDALVEIAVQHLDVVLSDRYIRLIRIVAAEVDQFPALVKAFYDHGPGLSYTNFKTFLEHRVMEENLKIANPSLAVDMFFGTLLHREVLARIYGVTAVQRNHKAKATSVADEFIGLYGA